MLVVERVLLLLATVLTVSTVTGVVETIDELEEAVVVIDGGDVEDSMPALLVDEVEDEVDEDEDDDKAVVEEGSDCIFEDG